MTAGKTKPAAGSIIAIQMEQRSRIEIENAILQVLGLGYPATVEETSLGKVLGTGGEGPETAAITLWADDFSAEYGVTWERRCLTGDLLFRLRPACFFPYPYLA